MEYLRIVLYVVLIIILVSIAIFNKLYRQQVKKVQNILSIDLSAVLLKALDVDVIVPTVLLLLGIIIALVSLF